MDTIANRVDREIAAGCIGPKMGCPYHPSHFTGQDCTFCYCPFFPCHDPTFGCNITRKSGEMIWSCEGCVFIHRPTVAAFVMQELRMRHLTAADSEALHTLFLETKQRFWHRGRALMVLGATSDAGKSVTAAALCRLLHRQGYLVTPFKSQNMSLNSRVTPKGCEISMIQMLQAQAAGLTNADEHMNPILLKPKGDVRSQVVVEGKPFGDYDVQHYYSEFVPESGKTIVKRNLDFLLNRYDYVVMEGAGSPAEINIYDADIANMRAAELADAVCLLVVNVEWGGAFAYAIGTVELLAPADRARVRGIILNNVRGDPTKLRDGADRLTALTGIPVLGIVPHLDVELPCEDSETFRSMSVRGHGSKHIAVIKMPRIANFTDLDPLYDEATVIFATKPADLVGAGAIILPGTKNTIDDLQWLRKTGMADAIAALKGKVPILGICGGYQMMGRVLHDPQGLEGSVPGDTPGLGFFDAESSWNSYAKRTVRDRGIIIDGGGDVEGYEIHMGTSESRETPLFRITSHGRRKETEGSVCRNEMLFGTYMHGIFDRPAFRERFLGLIETAGTSTTTAAPATDWQTTVDLNLDRLADGFAAALDMKAIDNLLEADR